VASASNCKCSVGSPRRASVAVALIAPVVAKQASLSSLLCSAFLVLNLTHGPPHSGSTDNYESYNHGVYPVHYLWP
jgi:hypothetical protein